MGQPSRCELLDRLARRAKEISEVTAIRHGLPLEEVQKLADVADYREAFRMILRDYLLDCF